MELNLLDGAWYAHDPHAIWSWMGAEAPVYYDEPSRVWGIARYDDGLRTEKDRVTFSSRRTPRPHGDPLPTMIAMDNPEHQRRRSMVARGFTPSSPATASRDTTPMRPPTTSPPSGPDRAWRGHDVVGPTDDGAGATT